MQQARPRAFYLLLILLLTAIVYNVISIIYCNVNAVFMSITPFHKITVIGGVIMKDKKAINVEIGARIKQAREQSGLTQERFAELIGQGPKNVSAVERGVVGISMSTLQRMCVVLSVPSDRILFDLKPENDFEKLTSKFKRLTPKQFEIAENVLNDLLEAFALND